MTAPCLRGSAVSPTVSLLHRLRPRAESRPPETQGARMRTFAEASWRSAAAAEWQARIFDMDSLIRRPSRLTTTSFRLVFRASAFLERHSQRSVRTIRRIAPRRLYLPSCAIHFDHVTCRARRGGTSGNATPFLRRPAAQKARRVNSPAKPKEALHRSTTLSLKPSTV